MQAINRVRQANIDSNDVSFEDAISDIGNGSLLQDPVSSFLMKNLVELTNGSDTASLSARLMFNNKFYGGKKTMIEGGMIRIIDKYVLCKFENVSNKPP